MQPFRELIQQGPDAFRAGIEALLGSYLTPVLRAQLLANDLQALLVLTQDRAALEEVLPQMTMPCLLFVGETDPRFPQVQQCVTHLPNATFFSLPGCDHVAALTRSDLVLPHVLTFLAKVRT
jgi:pimeloyl-ACP methyl ester carboxylesterase